MNREFLQLAHNFKPSKHGIGGWFVSEKLDGQRCFWDGGITRGIAKALIPWANTDKDDRLLREQYATGLWSRYGNVIHAPGWWLDTLPTGVPLDGELYIERRSRQRLMSIIKTLVPGPGWAKVKFFVFDIPPYQLVFGNGRINNTNYKKTFNWDVNKDLLQCVELKDPKPFRSIVPYITDLAIGHPIIEAVSQMQLPFQTTDANELVNSMLAAVTANGGEGLIVRSGDALWTPTRTHNMVKVKKLLDAEATVIGCTSGRQTDKGSKLLGKMGALIVKYDGKEFELSGFTDEEREFGDSEHTHWAIQFPGERCPPGMMPKAFNLGDRITFLYRELSDDGIPIEARYWRTP